MIWQVVEPQRELSTMTNAAKKVAEQQGMDIKYQEKLSRHLDRQDNLNQGLIRAYALIYTNYCTKMMQHRIQEHPEFESKIEDDPIALLEAIKTLTHDPLRAQNPMISATDALMRFLNLKQQEGEDLLDYVKRFKQHRDVVDSQLGKKIFYEFIEHQPEFRNSTSQTDKSKMQTDSFDNWCAYMLLRNSDQAKYGSLMKGFISQYSLGNDQYPKTLTTAIDVLSQHKIDAKYYENQKARREKAQSDRNDRNECNNDSVHETSFAQRDLTCYCCGKKGHSSTVCDKTSTIPQNEWWISKAEQHYQQMQDAPPASPPDDTGNDDSLTDGEQSVQSTSSTRTTSSRTNCRSGTSNRSTRGRHGWSHFQRTPFETELTQNQNQKYEHLQDVFILDTLDPLSVR